MTSRLTVKRFFRDKHGKIFIWQTPNLLLWLWLGLKVLIVFTDGNFKTNLNHLSEAVLFAWAYLEITDGESLFRKALGTVVLLFTIMSILA